MSVVVVGKDNTGVIFINGGGESLNKVGGNSYQLKEMNKYSLSRVPNNKTISDLFNGKV